jgi:hypothetical protein
VRFARDQADEALSAMTNPIHGTEGWRNRLPQIGDARSRSLGFCCIAHERERPMRLAVFIAVFTLISLSGQAEEASTALATACAQATSDLERHDLGCPDQNIYVEPSDTDAND